MAKMSNAATMPMPGEGWAREITVARKALVAPPVVSGTIQQCGVYLKDGSWCGHAATWRSNKSMTLPYDAPPKPVDKLAGRQLWCGQIWAHFGHFMCESLSRLWALDLLKEQPDGLVFMVKRPQRRTLIHGYQRAFMELFGIDLPITILNKPTEVEELIVPGQGFGLGPVARGTPEFHAFMHNRLIKGARPEGAKKLYISRSALPGQVGGVILEERLEQNLAASGYTIFHPQNHSLEVQIETYRAADQILGLDGSAFHMLGFVASPEQQIGVILRRNSAVYRPIVEQIDGFCGRAPDVIAALSSDWIPKDGVGRASRNSFGELDFAAIRAALIQNGYITEDAPWTVPHQREQRAAMAAIAKIKGGEFVSTRMIRREKRLARLAAAKASQPGDAPPAEPTE
jgi:hypothetical protein